VSDRACVEACHAGSGGALDHSNSGDLAYIISEYAEQPADLAGGQLVLALLNDGGRWLIASDMDRRDDG
jgi:hypothetical protein